MPPNFCLHGNLILPDRVTEGFLSVRGGRISNIDDHRPDFGQVIEITSPKVVGGGGGATFIGDDFDLVDFVCEEVRAIRAAVPGAAS